MYAISTFKRVYVWESPVRVFHWTNALSMLTLGVTGFIIADPPAIISGAEASNQYWFGITRFVHFIAAYIFTMGMIYRLIWAFFGNKYANWKAFFPYNKKGMKNLKHVLKIDVFLQNPKKLDYSGIAIGHNSLAAISYSFLFILMAIQIFTGFGLYSDNATWFLPKLFAWVVPLLGGDAQARLIHHIIMWLMAMFIVIHVYLVMYHDWLEERGEISSMFGGYKFVRKERVKDDKVNN